MRFPLSLRNVKDLLFERGIDISHDTVRHWWNRFGPLFAADVRRQRVNRMKGFLQPPGLGYLLPAILGLPGVDRRFRNPVPPSQISGLRTRLSFLQHANDLLF